MAQTRAWLLIALFIGVAITWTTSAATGRLFSTYAYFFDTANDTGNTITAGALQTPTLVSATAGPSTAPGTITLVWTNPSGDFATHIEIERSSTGCAGGFANIATVTKTPATYEDGSLAAGTYCYRIRGKINSWTSAYSVTKSATIDPAFTPTTLQLSSPNATTNTLVASGASGSRTISAGGSNFVVWNSTSSYTVKANANWTLNLVLDTSPPFQSTMLSVQVWVAASACGTTPGVGELVASGSSSTILPSGSTTNVSITLTPQTVTIPKSGTLCLKITNTVSDSGASHAARIIAAGASTLAGPFD